MVYQTPASAARHHQREEPKVEKSLSAQFMGSPMALMAVCPLLMLSHQLDRVEGNAPRAIPVIKTFGKGEPEKTVYMIRFLCIWCTSPWSKVVQKPDVGMDQKFALCLRP